MPRRKPASERKHRVPCAPASGGDIVSREITLPISAEIAKELRAGDEVELTGHVFTGRDQACARMFQMIQRGEKLPIELEGQLIYFVGPSPAKPGEVKGAQ